MDLLRLKDIGKIYVSDENVSVGIRKVNLTFNRGEFVAITGESGSGKSTLLNVISGMDSYEEGELFIDGDPTSHFVQEDWEEYREKYISFIFQNYNIIDSFTVLENVELALMHIDNPKERRTKALELIERVGLKSHINHKGSKLSGGQKQRTVIARALAKDSPIILADEPTGNLDSKTSKEIINLLKEVSKDKLLIVVTHDYEEVSEFVTRHIRVFNGSIESDHEVREKSIVENETKIESKKSLNKTGKNGLHLGKVLFKSKPRLSSFLSFLLFIGLAAIFLITSIFSTADAFEKSYMFNPSEGRLVIASRSGKAISDEELSRIVEKYDAEHYIHYDLLLDNNESHTISYYDNRGMKNSLPYQTNYLYGKDYGKNILGSYPSKDNEVLLYLPIEEQLVFGKDKLQIKEIYLYNSRFVVSGVKYFYDNNKDADILFTHDGFRFATALKYLSQGSRSVYLSSYADNYEINKQIPAISTSFDVEENKIYFDKDTYLEGNEVNETTTLKFEAIYMVYDNYNGSSKQYTFSKEFKKDYLVYDEENKAVDNAGVIFSSYIMIDMVEEVLSESYKQASIFFESDRKASKVIEELESEGYVVALSNTEYIMDSDDSIFALIIGMIMVIGWVITIIFMAFFINLCTHRSISSFKGDIAIMRSMGISKNVIKIGMHTRMLICLIPGLILTTILAFVIFLSPEVNPYFTFLYAKDYLAIFVGMVLLTVLTTNKQIKKLFKESVKKSLKGGAK